MSDLESLSMPLRESGGEAVMQAAFYFCLTLLSKGLRRVL